jgi:hypothetical protein
MIGLYPVVILVLWALKKISGKAAIWLLVIPVLILVALIIAGVTTIEELCS